MKDKTKNAIDKLYTSLEPEFKYIIDKIKSRPQITRNNYSEYYSQIINLREITKLNYKIIAILLHKAGGSKAGINDAMKIINQ